MNELLIAVTLASTFVATKADAKEVFACNTKGLSVVERARHRELTKKLLGSVAAKVELPDGYGFELDRSLVPAAAEWMELESKCCPFFTFDLELERRGGPLWLRLTGAEGVKPFIREEFKL